MKETEPKHVSIHETFDDVDRKINWEKRKEEIKQQMYALDVYIPFRFDPYDFLEYLITWHESIMIDD